MIGSRLKSVLRRVAAGALPGERPSTMPIVWDQMEQLKLLAAEPSIHRVRALEPRTLADVELRVFSQFGDDGILQYLTQKLRLGRDVFVEFGVQDYTESNTRLLALRDDWRGLVMDGSASHVAAIRAQTISWRHDVTAIQAFITRENIDQLLRATGVVGRIGVLSVDIDGNDYWVWEAISVVQPAIVIVEYNSLFGANRAVTVPYDPLFVRQRAHYSYLYFGASLRALALLAERKGYVLVGSNSNGNNAYFVERARAEGLPRPSPEECWVDSRFRESRDEHGALTFASGARRRELIADMIVEDVERGERVRVGALEP